MTETTNKEPGVLKYTVCVGSLTTGFELFELFDDSVAAHKWAAENVEFQDYDVLPIHTAEYFHKD